MNMPRIEPIARADRRISERIALAAQEWIGCAYCLEAHAAAARELGLRDSEIALARQGTATDRRIAAIVAFGQRVIAAPAEVADEPFEELRGWDYSDGQIAEVIGLVSLQLLTGGFNLVAGIHPANLSGAAA